MNEQPQSQKRVTVAEAATVLGVSKETVRRMIREGRLDAERTETSRRTPTYLVTLPDSGPAPRRSSALVHSVQPMVEGRPEPTADMLSAFSRAITPLVDRLVDQAETIGRLRAEAGLRRRPAARRSARTKPGAVASV